MADQGKIEPVLLADLLEERRICRARFTKKANIVRQCIENANKLMDREDIDHKKIAVSIRKAITSFNELAKVYQELSGIQENVDFHPDNEVRLADVKDDRELEYTDMYLNLAAEVQQLEFDLNTDLNAEKASDKRSQESNKSFTPEQFTACFKEALETVNTGIAAEQLQQILDTLTHKKRIIQIPKFKGDTELFDQWRNLVDSEVEKPGYSAVEKTHLLISLLEGDVAKLVSALKDPTYDEIMLFLEHRYGDVLARIEKAVNEIANVSLVTSPTVKELDPLYNKLLANWNYITKHAKEDNTVVKSSWILTALVRPKVPKSLLKKWDAERLKDEKKSCHTSSLPVSFDIFLEKIQDALKVARRSDSLSASNKEKKKDISKAKPESSGHALNVTRKDGVRQASDGVRQQASDGVRQASDGVRQQASDGVRQQASDCVRQQTPGSVRPKEKCIFCDSFHMAFACPKATDISVTERYNRVKASGACFNCLSRNHQLKSCKSGGCKVCNGNHHTLLHRRRDEGRSEITSSKTNTEKSRDPEKVETSTGLIRSSGSSEILMQSGIVKLESRSAITRGRVLLDSGSGVSFISREMAKKLNLSGPKVKGEFTLAGGQVMNLNTEKVKFHLSSAIPSWKGETLEIVAYIIDKPSAPIKKTAIDISKLSYLKGLQLADTYPHGDSGEIDVMLGIEDTMNILLDKRIPGPRGMPVAQKTHIGWILCGPCPLMSTSTVNGVPGIHSCSAVFNLKSETDIATHHWDTEHIGILPTEKPKLTDLEMSALQQHAEKTTFIGDRYETGLIRHPNYVDQKLKSNKDLALRRWIGQEKRLRKDPELEKQYHSQIQELFAADRAEKVIEDKEPEDRQVWYLPHHPVVKMDRSTTKVRVVFDGSMVGHEGVSLNDTLLPGPALQPDLPGVLLRFRRHKIALVADVEKMFLQTKMREIDRDSQRFFYRAPNSTEDPEIYRLTTVIFGLTPSPFSSIKTLLDHVQKHKDECPKAVSEIEENIFVDDVLSGADTVNEASDLAVDMKTVLKTGGFPLRKFLSNKPEALAKLDEKDLASHHTITVTGEETATKTLGVKYLPSEDVLMFSFYQKMDDTECESRRTVLQQLHRVYDPLGMLSPFTVTAKQIFQKTWMTTGTWDEELPQELELEWRKWKEEVPILDDIKIDRCFVPETFTDPVYSLHGFGDASEASYGGAAYLRIEDRGTSAVHTALLCSRTRVAPIGKRRSIPELELIAALINARLVKYVERELKLPIESITCWTDSQVVLQWISKPAYSWQTFVANRVSEIQNLVQPSNWKYVPSGPNPADLCSRGISAKALVESRLWWEGPLYLRNEESAWPRQEIPTAENVEKAKKKSKPKSMNVFTVVQNQDQRDDLLQHYAEKFSSHEKFLRVMMLVRSWLEKHRSTKDTVSNEHDEGSISFSPSDRQREEIFWIRWAQRKAFPDEIAALRSGEPVSKQSKLLQLNPFWDSENEVIRVGGRLKYTNLPEETKHPIILPTHNVYVEKLVMHYHVTNLHTGPAQTLANLRNSYWLVHGRQEVRRILHKCRICRILAKLGQQMAQLPVERASMEPAFTNVGVDFAGPLYVKVSTKENKKAYICLFSCMATRAVHLELVEDLSTEQFLLALNRMMSRRGRCSRIYSDNAKTFKSADSILQRLFRKNANELRPRLEAQGIEWKFITERAPWHGGFYERMVGSVKRALKKVLGNSRLTYVEMETLLAQVEAQVNSRPLTVISSSSEDLAPLTPGHLAIGRSPQSLPDIDKKTSTTSMGKRWLYQQRLMKQFWNRWYKEYLLELNYMRKWVDVQRNVKVGDVVLIADDDVRCHEWMIGRVVDVHPGRDGLIRSVTVKTQKGLRRRPVQRLRLLESDDEQ